MNNKELEDLIYNYKTVSEYGLLDTEVKELVKEHFEDKKSPFNWDKYYDAMMGNTCMMHEGKIVNYHCDVVTGIRCATQNRDKYGYEFD